MIYSETPRLFLRSLEKSDLHRLTELIGDWEVARWLAVVPHPYNLSHAEEFYAKLNRSSNDNKRWPDFYALSYKNNDLIVGGIGVRHSLEPNPRKEEKVIGYWLGRSYWRQGVMSEAIMPALELTFQNPEVDVVTATTDLDNQGSKNVLNKAGFVNLGTHPRTEPAVRGGSEIVRWELQRKNYKSGS